MQLALHLKSLLRFQELFLVTFSFVCPKIAVLRRPKVAKATLERKFIRVSHQMNFKKVLPFKLFPADVAGESSFTVRS